MLDLPLNALRAFALVYAHGGVRAAARELGISHSSVSRHLAELERWLGVAIIENAGARRGLVLTAQGEALGRAVLESLEDIASSTAALREKRSPYAVTISTSPSVAARWLLPRLPSLERAHPRIELSVVINQRLEDLATGGIDLALRMGAGPWPGVDSEPLMDDGLYPVMSRSFWEDHGRPDRLARLGELRLLHDRDPQASWDRWRAKFGPPDLDLARGPRFASSDLVLRAAAQGQGVALARGRLAADDVDSGLLIRPFGDREIALGTSYWIVRTRQSRRQRPAIAIVVDWLRSRV